jgi:hypothetical protein
MQRSSQQFAIRRYKKQKNNEQERIIVATLRPAYFVQLDATTEPMWVVQAVAMKVPTLQTTRNQSHQCTNNNVKRVVVTRQNRHCSERAQRIGGSVAFSFDQRRQYCLRVDVSNAHQWLRSILLTTALPSQALASLACADVANRAIHLLLIFDELADRWTTAIDYIQSSYLAAEARKRESLAANESLQCDNTSLASVYTNNTPTTSTTSTALAHAHNTYEAP